MTYFFYHIPKTGGTSFKRVLESWFKTKRDEDCTPDVLRTLAAERPADLCIHGHCGGALLARTDSFLARYPWVVGNPDAHVFCFIRDPVERAISFYYHELERGRTDLSLLEFISQPHDFEVGRVLSLRSADQIDDLIASFAYIGPTEDLQGGADRIAEMFDKPKVTVPRQRVGMRDGQILEVTAEERSRVEKTLELECELYARVRDALSGARPIERDPTQQFKFLTRYRSVRPRAGGSTSDAPKAAHLTGVLAHGADGKARASFSVSEPVGVTLEFEISDDAATIEPAIGLAREGQKVFTAAFTPAEDAPLHVGVQKATAWIPANLLNPGQYEIDASLATPNPVKRHDVTAEPLVIKINEAPASTRSARGSWKGQFPGPIRPLLEWQLG